MQLELIGPGPFARDEQGRQMTRIGTVFPDYAVLCTQSPCIHAMQRLSFMDRLNAQRATKSIPPLSPEEEQQLCLNAVDLIFESDHILIRPDPGRMEVAFAADDLLQGLVSKRQVKFLSVADRRVREAIKRRGEFWRLSWLPKTLAGKERLLLESRVAIDGLPIYYYNRLTGTRWLTFGEFEGLGQLDDASLARTLQEIADHSILRNRMGRPEMDFFAADPLRFRVNEFGGVLYTQLPHEGLRTKFEELRERFRSAVQESYRRDDLHNKAWSERILSTLFLEGDEAQSEQIPTGLSPEFFLQVEWLPGGRFEEGEFLFDTIFDEAPNHPGDEGWQRLCDPKVKGLIFNLIREYGDLEYINVGKLPESLSLDRPQKEGRRGVYLAEFQSRSERTSLKRFMRLQKWGVWEQLDKGNDLLHAIKLSDDYTDYWLDRRLGCRQLGMNLTGRVVMRHLNEIYAGRDDRYRGQTIRTTYFEREYLAGIASDKLPPEKYGRPGYATRLAALLGQAAAVSMIVGRSFESGTIPVFDDGDEVVCEGEDGLPSALLVGDHSGAFGEYQRPLEFFASHYARPVNCREKVLPNAQEFAQAYLAAFRAQCLHIQGDYVKRRRAFDTLFKHCRYDPGGSFAYRWECVLRRLDHTPIDELMEAIRRHINVLKSEPAPFTTSQSAVPELAVK